MNDQGETFDEGDIPNNKEESCINHAKDDVLTKIEDIFWSQGRDWIP